MSTYIYLYIYLTIETYKYGGEVSSFDVSEDDRVRRSIEVLSIQSIFDKEKEGNNEIGIFSLYFLVT
jgi:hypothetical protein